MPAPAPAAPCRRMHALRAHDASPARECRWQDELVENAGKGGTILCPSPRQRLMPIMTSRISSLKKRPAGVLRGWAKYGSARHEHAGFGLTDLALNDRPWNDLGVIGLARLSPRIVVSADSRQPPPGGEQSGPWALLVSGTSAFANRPAGSHRCRAGLRATAMNRAQYPGSVPRPRGWRLFDDNAHANRCAPPGRNPGGGAQRQPN